MVIWEGLTRGYGLAVALGRGIYRKVGGFRLFVFYDGDEN